MSRDSTVRSELLCLRKKENSPQVRSHHVLLDMLIKKTTRTHILVRSWGQRSPWERSLLHKSPWRYQYHNRPNIHHPDHFPMEALVNTVSSFFVNKISIIRSSFSSGSCASVLNLPDTGKVLQHLTYVADDEVRHLDLLALCNATDLDQK